MFGKRNKLLKQVAESYEYVGDMLSDIHKTLEAIHAEAEQANRQIRDITNYPIPVDQVKDRSRSY